MNSATTPAISERAISFSAGLASIPERLLLAHARGEVLFICGAGISRPAGLPDFRNLVVKIYEVRDPVTYQIIRQIPHGVCNRWETDLSDLNNQQIAEVRRFIAGDYDVVLGMLERRLDGQQHGGSRVRQTVAEILCRHTEPAPIHRSLMRLADRGGATTIVTTNFDLLLEKASMGLRPRPQTYSLGAIPRPSRRTDFNGILHIHGALDSNLKRISELVLSDQDFGEFYLRRRVVPDFIYDAARLYNLVLVGYSANDPPMRYLLNAVSADGSRFEDLKDRFVFISSDSADSVALEDWRARGIIPISYDAANGHSTLSDTLTQWASLAPMKEKVVNARIRQIVRIPRADSTDSERDLFDHLFRRSNTSERNKIAELASTLKADHEWLDAMLQISQESN